MPYDSADSSKVEGHWDPVVEEGALEQFDTKEVNYISIFLIFTCRIPAGNSIELMLGL